MLHDSPLRTLHEEYIARGLSGARSGKVQADRPGAATGQRVAAEVHYIPYGGPGDAEPACEIVAGYAEVELEYAAIRRGAGVMDSPHRGTLLVTGDLAARREFFNRMLTQELKDLSPGIARRSFWLNRKGRIEADLLLMELGDRMLVDVDILNAARSAQTLNEFIVAEDVQIEDASSKFHHIALHGRHALQTLAAVSGTAAGTLENAQAGTMNIEGVNAAYARREQVGEPGLELVIPYEDAATVWTALLSIPPQPFPVRPIGWHAFNIARIEAGTPVFNVDFGPTNLPHETGVLRERVSFTKGCYLGQEVVARMEHLGRPKQMLVGLRMLEDLLPTSGEQVFSMNEDGSMGEEIGVVTSSTLSPMLGAAPIAFAMIKSAHADVGREVIVNAEGAQSKAAVSPLSFWPAQSEQAGG